MDFNSRYVFHARFRLGWTFLKIGGKLGLTESRVCQIFNSLANRLKKEVSNVESN